MAHQISTLIILAGPSGAGKTTLATKIIAGVVIADIELDSIFTTKRIDIKLLEKESELSGNIILEYAINNFINLPESLPSSVISLINQAQTSYVITIEVDKVTLSKRYVSQMFGATGRRTPKWMRIFQFRKIYRYCRYRYSDDIEKYYENWTKLLNTELGHCKKIMFIQINDDHREF